MSLATLSRRSVAVAAACFLYQSIILRTARDRVRLFSLFKSHAGIGLIILAGIWIGYRIP